MTTLRSAIALTAISIAAIMLFQIAAGRSVHGVALPSPAIDEPRVAAHATETAVFAGGCFWGVQGVFQHVAGVDSAISGYSGGDVAMPTYDIVSTGMTGHAESVRVTYDPSKVSYGTLLRVFFSVAHDPTQLNFQGPDHGTQYRSAIFTANDEQSRVATAYVAQLRAAKAFTAPIVTEIQPLKAFYPAEDYHQNYMSTHRYSPYILAYDTPKLTRLKQTLPALYRD